MTDQQITVAGLKADVLPALFEDAVALSQYGSSGSNADAVQELSQLLEGGAVSALASKVAEILSKLADADPQRVSTSPSWYERLVGSAVERQVRYQVARQSLDGLLEEAHGLAQRVRDTLLALDGLMASHEAEVARLGVHIQAGREFLGENPRAGVAAPGALEFDRPRERLARKLANLATLLSSHELSVTQLQLTRAQAVDMLDRFTETSTVLVPVWRQHTLALISSKTMDPAMVLEATKAHQALIRSLSKSLEGVST